jgi:hypothetical protein
MPYLLVVSNGMTLCQHWRVCATSLLSQRDVILSAVLLTRTENKLKFVSVNSALKNILLFSIRRSGSEICA